MIKQIDTLTEDYSIDKYNFIHQIKKNEFEYSIDYKEKQSTDVKMSHLRLGWVSSFFDYECMKSMNMVDIGCGNNMFLNACEGKFKEIKGYDVSGESITKQELYETNWDLIVLSDVLEHFEDINDLFKLKWKFAMISYPETPMVDTFDELKKWRHFKPNEHLHYLNIKGMYSWFCDNDVKIAKVSHMEDLIRKRWDEKKPNITTILATKALKTNITTIL